MVKPYVEQELALRGFALVRVDTGMARRETDMIILASLVGQNLGQNFSYRIIESLREDAVLAAHSEGISFTAGIVPAFALGCITAAASGGETRLFDGRRAAHLVQERHPEWVKTIVHYTSLGNEGESSFYPLIIADPKHGPVLRYRSKVSTNRVDLKPPADIDRFYATVDAILEECLIVTHHWQGGDLMFVDNSWTLHDRLPFKGHRRMARIRFGDSVAPGLSY